MLPDTFYVISSILLLTKKLLYIASRNQPSKNIAMIFCSIQIDNEINWAKYHSGNKSLL